MRSAICLASVAMGAFPQCFLQELSSDRRPVALSDQNVTISLIFDFTPALTEVCAILVLKSFQSLNGPFARSVTIAPARDLPMLGRASSCSGVAVFRSTL